MWLNLPACCDKSHETETLEKGLSCQDHYYPVELSDLGYMFGGEGSDLRHDPEWSFP